MAPNRSDLLQVFEGYAQHSLSSRLFPPLTHPFLLITLQKTHSSKHVKRVFESDTG